MPFCNFLLRLWLYYTILYHTSSILYYAIQYYTIQKFTCIILHESVHQRRIRNIIRMFIITSTIHSSRVTRCACSGSGRPGWRGNRTGWWSFLDSNLSDTSPACRTKSETNVHEQKWQGKPFVVFNSKEHNCIYLIPWNRHPKHLCSWMSIPYSFAEVGQLAAPWNPVQRFCWKLPLAREKKAKQLINCDSGRLGWSKKCYLTSKF